jgi:hypothetical protein
LTHSNQCRTGWPQTGLAIIDSDSDRIYVQALYEEDVVDFNEVFCIYKWVVPDGFFKVAFKAAENEFEPEMINTLKK